MIGLRLSWAARLPRSRMKCALVTMTARSRRQSLARRSWRPDCHYRSAATRGRGRKAISPRFPASAAPRNRRRADPRARPFPPCGHFRTASGIRFQERRTGSIDTSAIQDRPVATRIWFSPHSCGLKALHQGGLCRARRFGVSRAPGAEVRVRPERRGAGGRRRGYPMLTTIRSTAYAKNQCDPVRQQTDFAVPSWALECGYWIDRLG